MMIISQMKFRKYLDNQHNPQHHINPTNIISQLPSITHSSIPTNIADGECDIIVISRQYGILVGEVKSVGGHPSSNQDHIIARVVAGAITQLQNQEVALSHLVHDMVSGNIRLTKTVLLPNVTSAQLATAVNSSQQLQQALVQCTDSQDTAQAIGRCLCSDQLQQPGTWWNALWTGGPDPSMSDTTYERLAARFCGPASTVDIPTTGHPFRVLRDLGEAVAETTLRFSSLVLTPDQLRLLNAAPEPPFLYLQGPPGCGKTVMLLLKALQWARRGVTVVVVDYVNTAVVMLLEEQLVRLLGATAAAAAGRVQRCRCYLDDVNRDVGRLVQLLGHSGQAFILFDEAPEESDDFIPWLKAVRSQLPTVSVWAAGLIRWDNKPTRPLPPWLQVETLCHPLRCPSAVARQVERSPLMNGRLIPRYSAPVLPVPTEGPPVRHLQHPMGQDGHSQDEWPWRCSRCADTIAGLLTELRVGQPGRPQHRDVFILCHYLPDARDADVMVGRLHVHHGVPVRALSDNPSAAEARDMALALTDQVIVTDMANAEGLERAVVIVLGSVADPVPCSRSTSFLCVIVRCY